MNMDSIKRLPEQRRAELAANTAKEEIQLLLLEDPSRTVRASLGRSRHATALVLTTLARDADALVRSSVLQNAVVDEDLMVTFAHDPERRVREMLAGLSSDANVHQILVQDLEWRVRYFLAGNPDLDASIVRVLLEDIRPAVRTTVRSNRHLKVTTEFPVSYFSGLEENQALLHDMLEAAGISPEWSPLVDDWKGSVVEFIRMVTLLREDTVLVE